MADDRGNQAFERGNGWQNDLCGIQRSFGPPQQVRAFQAFTGHPSQFGFELVLDRGSKRDEPEMVAHPGADGAVGWLAKVATDWLVPFRFRVPPVPIVTLFPESAPLTLVCRMPAFTANEPRNDGFAAPKVSVPVPLFVTLLAAAPVMAPVMPTALEPATVRAFEPRPTAPLNASPPLVALQVWLADTVKALLKV